MKRKYVILLSGLLILAMILTTGCLKKPAKESNKDSGGMDAETVLAKNKEVSGNVKSVKVKSDVNISAKVDMTGLTESGGEMVDVGVKMNIDMLTSPYSAIGQMVSKTSVMGKSETTIMKVYEDIEHGVAYTKTNGSDHYVMTDAGVATNYMTNLNEIDVDPQLFTFEENDDAYILTASLKDLKNSDSFLAFESLAQNPVLDGFSIGDEGQIRYEFDKKTFLTKKVAMEKMKMKNEGNSTADIKDMSMDMNVVFSDYNKASEDELKIPEDVIESAEKADASDPNLGLGTGGQSSETTIDNTQSKNDVKTTKPSKSSTKTTKGIVLHGSEVNSNTKKYCFVVGEDISAGTYRIYHASGQGVFRILDPKTYKDKYRWNAGYKGLEKEDFKDGEKITVTDGDEIYITENLNVKIKKN